MLGDPMALSALVTLVVIALWASARLPEYLVALLFFAAVMVLQLAPAAVTFSGFASSAFWLVLSGFVLGTAIRSTGLADRLANRLLPHLAGSATHSGRGGGDKLRAGVCHAFQHGAHYAADADRHGVGRSRRSG